MLNRRSISTLVLAAALALSLPLAAQQIHCSEGNCLIDSRTYRDGNQWVQELTGSIDAAKGVRISSAIGFIQVRGSSQPNVTFTIKKRVNRSSEEQARRELNVYAIRIVRKGEVVYVEGYWDGGHSNKLISEFYINVPKETSMVKADTNGGSIGINSISGKAIAETSGGSITLNDIGGSASASTSGGSISAGNMGGDVKLETSGGSISIGNISGHINANTSGGSIDVESGKKDVILETAGGSIRISQCSGSLIASTAGGSVDAGDVGGDATLETAGGSIRLKSAKGAVTATNQGGGIHLMRLTRGVRAETAAGSIEAEFIASPSDFTESNLETVAGDIIVYLPSDLPVTVKAGIELANGHSIRSDFPGLKITSEGDKWGPKEIYAEGRLNGGGPVLKVHTTNGSIEFRKTSSSKH